MRKKWVGFIFVFSIIMSLLAPAGYPSAADRNVKVSLPNFSVYLNGHAVENQYREYPLLVYRGITYFPMTWYDSRLLGLEANWSPDNGLNIKQSLVTSSYVPYKSNHRNATSYTAKIPASVVTINGKEIDNTKEKYPFLSFRNVTYFPLTWRFAHDEFKWDYQWSSAEGLKISSHNPQLQTVSLPKYAGENDIALFKGYYYFVETTGMTNHIYRAPVQQLYDKEEVYSYNFYISDRNPKAVTFQIRDHALWLTYHLGGGLTGTDYFVKINEDGKAELIHSGYLEFLDTSYGTLIVLQGASAFEGGNLYLLSSDDGKNRKSVGDPNLMYGVTYNDNWSLGPSDASYTAVVGDDVFVLASRSEFDANKVYKINLITNKTDKIVDTSVRRFRVIDNKLYYVKDEDNLLYTSTLDGTGEMKLSDLEVSRFDGLDGNVFYTTKKESNQFELYQANPNGEDPKVWKTTVTGVQVLNDRLICLVDGRIVLLDDSGNLIVQVADPISRVLTSEQGVLFKSARESSIEFIR